MPLIKNNTNTNHTHPNASFGYTPVSLVGITTTENIMTSISTNKLQSYSEADFIINIQGNVRFKFTSNQGAMWRILPLRSDEGGDYYEGSGNYSNSGEWEGVIAEHETLNFRINSDVTFEYFEKLSGISGFMSGEDKEKLNNLEKDYNEWSYYITDILRDKGIL